MSFESSSKSTSDRCKDVVCIITAALSALTQATILGILTALLVVDLAATRLRVPVLVAIVFNAMVTLSMLAIVAGVVRPARKTKEWCLLFVSLGISLTTSILSGYILVRTWNLYKLNASSSARSLTASLVVAGLTIWSANIITQFMTYALVLPTRSCFGSQPDEITTIGYRYPGSSPRRRFSLSFKSLASPTAPEKVHLTDPYSPSSASLRSLKSSRPGSVSQVFGPLGSKTRLLITQSLHGNSEVQLARREPSLEIACRGETPELSHNTTPVYELSSSPPLIRHPSPLTRLETIPGSRPVSPAKPLDGPYLGRDARPASTESITFTRAQSPASAQSSSPVYDLPFPPMIGEVAFQSHIHPLFRSGSPGPPPVISPGTTVTAAPQAGQIVTTNTIKRQRSAHNSRSATPEVSPTESVPNFSRPGLPSSNDPRAMNMI